jgi:hypothetical protein
MKKLLFLMYVSLIPFITNSQYSNYYNVDVNSNSRVSGTINVNKNVNVSGYTTQTINTIDYGKLSLANAQREKNRLESLIYADEKSRQQAIEIAAEPMKAHEFGKFTKYKYRYTNDGWKKTLIQRGLKSFDESHIMPHKSLFQNIGQGRWENVSTDGITTEIIAQLPLHNYSGTYKNIDEIILLDSEASKQLEYYKTHSKPKKNNYRSDKIGYGTVMSKYLRICDSLDNYYYARADLKSKVRFPTLKEGEKFLNYGGDSAYCHKKLLVKRTVYGHPGFRSTLIWEDEFEICITDNYMTHYDNIEYYVKVRYKADKESGITFKDLEGRRYYLSKFVDKHAASRRMTNIVKCNPKKDFSIPKRKNFNNSQDYEKAIEKFWSVGYSSFGF